MSRQPQLYPWTRPQAQRVLQGIDRLPHALLLSGPRGLGKAQFAALLSVVLSCERPDLASATACGACQNCIHGEESACLVPSLHLSLLFPTKFPAHAVQTFATTAMSARS